MPLFRLKAEPWLMWFMPLSFFAYQFILRLWPGLMMPQIMEQFKIDAKTFGFLSAMYYVGYAAMQIPIAMYLDRYGPKIVLSICAVICGLGTLLFTVTDHWLFAVLGRFLIGVGSAAGFLGTSKAVALWFPLSQYARMIGLTFTFGLMGALYGGKPITLLIESMGWKSVALFIALGGIGIGILIFLLFKTPKKSVDTKNKNLQIKDLKTVLTTPALVWLAVANLLMVGALEGFADVWGPNYLAVAYQFDQSDAAGLVSFIFIGMLFGGPLLAILNEKWGIYQVIIMCSVGMAGLFFLILFGKEFLNANGLRILFFLVGILCCYQVLVFAAGSKLLTAQFLGVTVAFLNCINMLGGSFFHTIIGYLMDLFWAGGIVNETRVYTVDSYIFSLLAIPICSLMGGIIVKSVSNMQSRKA